MHLPQGPFGLARRRAEQRAEIELQESQHEPRVHRIRMLGHDRLERVMGALEFAALDDQFVRPQEFGSRGIEAIAIPLHGVQGRTHRSGRPRRAGAADLTQHALEVGRGEGRVLCDNLLELLDRLVIRRAAEQPIALEVGTNRIQALWQRGTPARPLACKAFRERLCDQCGDQAWQAIYGTGCLCRADCARVRALAHLHLDMHAV